jgi:hypothetical protein
MQDGQPIALYDVVLQGFAELGATGPRSAVRSLLLRDGHFLGQRFASGHFEAIWLAEEGTIEFRDQSGRLMKTTRLASDGMRRAA